MHKTQVIQTVPMPTTELSRISEQYTLWEIRFKGRHDPLYFDQFGRRQDGYLVVNEYRVEIVEVIPVFSTHDIFMFHGWLATSQEGLEFRTDPDGSWYILNQPDKPYRQFGEACTRYNSRAAVCITPDGQLAKPRNAFICVDHDTAFDPNHKKGCHECNMNRKYPPQ
ncbi:hypothetical protein H0W80_01295 [Candidatus Saccharibacteria bacterium]|nr:hypothetical protein [Candidatus Saccharibacteria bacterium]